MEARQTFLPVFKCYIYPENGRKGGRLLKLLVKVELENPLIRGTKINLDDEVIWVEFRYEMLPTFCYYCGIIDYVEKFCDNKMEYLRKERVREGEYGEWMRANLLKVEKNG